MRYAPRLYRKLQHALARLLSAARPSQHQVLGFIALRSAILVDLGLPSTERNIDRLMLCASAGLPLRVFRCDVDVSLPAEGLASARLPSLPAEGLAGMPSRPGDQGRFGSLVENQPPVSASRSAVSASIRS